MKSTIKKEFNIVNNKTVKDDVEYEVSKTKVLLFDIETAPMEAYVWGTFDVTIPQVMVKRDWYTLCWNAKWLGSKKMLGSALPDFKDRYKKDSTDDYAVALELNKLLDEADIVVGHNGDSFDIKKMNARFIQLGISPPSPFKSIDTLKVARRHFKFSSNKLDSLGEFLGVGKKVDTGGFKLWIGCMEGDKKAWSKMTKYCAQDVNLLEEVYLKLRPWMSNHPVIKQVKVRRVKEHHEMRTPHAPECPCCESPSVQKRGFAAQGTSQEYQRWSCNDCDSWSRSYTHTGTKTFDKNKPLQSMVRK